jgi:hypothetical protein
VSRGPRWTPRRLGAGGTSYWLRPSRVVGGLLVPDPSLTLVSGNISAAAVGGKTLVQATASKRPVTSAVDLLDGRGGYQTTTAALTELMSSDGGVTGGADHAAWWIGRHGTTDNYRGLVTFGPAGTASTVGAQGTNHWGGGPGFVQPSAAGDEGEHLFFVEYAGGKKRLFVDDDRTGTYEATSTYAVGDARFGIGPAFSGAVASGTIREAGWMLYAPSASERRALAHYAATEYPSAIANDNALLAIGDSQSKGFGTTASPANWPSRLAALGLLTFPFTILMEATVAHTTTLVLADFGPFVVRFSRCRKRCIATVWAGTNDLFFGATAASTWTNLMAICAALRAAGWYVILFTVLPRTEPGTAPTYESERGLLNPLILGAVAAGVADDVYHVAAKFPDSTNGAYYQLAGPAGVHLNQTANDMIAVDIAAKANAVAMAA